MPKDLDRKELKKPDQFVTFWTKLGPALVARKRVVIGALVTVVVAVGGVWAARSFTEQRGASMSRAFARVQRVAAASLIPEKGDAAKVEDDLPHFKTDKERLEAAAKEAESFIAAHAGSRISDDAKLLLARFQLGLGRTAEAEKLYTELLHGGLDAKLKFVAQQGLAHTYEATGKPDQAIKIFEQLAADAQGAGGFYRDRALYDRARLHAAKGDKKEAEKLLREILEKSPSSSLRDEINDRLAVLEGK